MERNTNSKFNRKNGKKFLSKNKSIKIYKQKQCKIQSYKQEIAELQKKYDQIDVQSVKTFDDFPLSERTRKGLKNANYVIPTEIQKDSIGLALKGHDILGAAQTGSGKTLAFVIPLIEILYCSGWSILDGIGAIVITPIRELAYQIFEVLNKVGSFHQFSAALVIGGKDLAKERELLNKCNILICTPGRLLQHMDENPLFNCMNLKILILDEADRILELAFQETINAILGNLPMDRQTLLFSATQTKSVKDLARLSLKNPVYVSVHEHAKHSTPESLRQNYLECEAHSKMNLLWSFIKSHKKQKILVFMATCKQVKYTFESICRMRPGVSIMALYGSLHQLRRMQIYDEFCKKNHAVMLATDVAARGLDFPNVNWVVQLDCPENTNVYIHRAGRTARYEKNGESLLVLLPSEKESMVEQLKKRKIPIEEIKVNPHKFQDVRRKLEALCARDDELKNSAERAYKAYLKSIVIMKDKTVFKVAEIDPELYAKSLGLEFVPRVRFLENYLKSRGLSTSRRALLVNDCDSDEDLLTSKTNVVMPVEEEDDLDESQKQKKIITKAAIAKRILKKNMKVNTITKFDEKGNPIREICGKPVPVVAADLQNQLMEEGYSIEKAKLLKQKEEEVDKLLYQGRIKQKHREERLKMKSKRKKEEGVAPQLAPSDGAEEDEDEDEEEEESDIDPNKLMSSNSSEEEGSLTDNSDSESEEEIQNRKRKKASSEENAKRQKKDQSSKSFHNAVRSLDDDEQLALHFLTAG